jgi:hypothetical protein
MAVPRRRRSTSIFILILVGSIGLVTLMGRPRFQMYATVDVLQLLASGLCFGLALGALLRTWRGDRG